MFIHRKAQYWWQLYRFGFLTNLSIKHIIKYIENIRSNLLERFFNNKMLIIKNARKLGGNMKKIGIIGAMELEVTTLKSLMKIENTVKKASLTFYEGKLEDKEIVLVQCGIGKVNSALCAQILISEFNVNAIVNTGVAGAIHSSLDVNDIVISTEAIQYDVDARAFGYKKGQIPQMDNSIFIADERLINAAYESSLAQVKDKEFKIVKGRVATGDIFISSKELKEELENDFNAYCGEMEGAAIAHACYLNNIPFVIIRAMSDKADGSANVTYDEFVIEAAENSKDIVLKMLRAL
ncbi:5'-methylthioadenosine/S-adenosylhomocysteine nucleosidase [Terrisporobacter mayombei]|uniref:adenosylhomocysteine nucleosidase n=2 Tax=Terrisporobacter mayombei TaxID=1541 RepID=A0ABY9Q334_9FIRM|nr:5'-methylthioadenosine/S-adenosylhomocysteine nucleosidase [Terrisporobacter mayombei]